jgi:hypothetical protein
MISDLKLKGNHLFAYALIYGFSQDGQSKFTGSINYVCKWLNCSRNTAIRVLKDLTSKNLLKKEQETINNVIYNKYSIKVPNTSSAGIEPPVQKKVQGSAEIDNRGSSETAPNNTIINNTNYKSSSEKEFLEDWNKYRKEHLKKPSYLNRLTRDEKEYLNDLLTDYSREDIKLGLIGLFKQKKMPNGNTTMQSSPRHFLSHFNSYFTAYHDKNSSLYGQDKPEIL